MHQEHELFNPKKKESEFFGVLCLVERPTKNTIKITCNSKEDALLIIRSFWKKRDLEMDKLFNSGMLKPEQEITSGARTTIIEYQGQIIVLINENDNPLSEKTLMALRDGGLAI